MRSQYPMKKRTVTCRDCGQEFEARAWNAVRCHSCKTYNGQPKKRTPRAKERT